MNESLKHFHMKMHIFNWKRLIGVMGLVILWFAVPAMATTIELDMKAYIDGRDLLVIHDDTLQWHHLDFAAVGRWEGGNGNEATIISTWLDGVPQMTDVNWSPDWPELPSAGIRYEAYSSVLTGLFPTLPLQDMSVTLIPILGRYSTSISQLPDRLNNYTIIADFNDDPPSGADWYEMRIRLEYTPQGVPDAGTTTLLLLIGSVVPVVYLRWRWFCV